MKKPKVIVISGYGINCDEETKFAFQQAGGKAELVHVNELANSKKKLQAYEILVFPGGFSFGDDTGSGNALAWKVRNNIYEEIIGFVEKGKLVLGICNGFQVLVNLGLVPGYDGYDGKPQAALIHNDSATYVDRWVDLQFYGNSPWLSEPLEMSLPIAHGEGKFYAPEKTLSLMEKDGRIAAKYISGRICEQHNLPPNPNGSLRDIAAVTDGTGRILGMMPHPERAIDFTHLPCWPQVQDRYKREGRKVPSHAGGLSIFKNGIRYFR